MPTGELVPIGLLQEFALDVGTAGLPYDEGCDESGAILAIPYEGDGATEMGGALYELPPPVETELPLVGLL